MNEKTDYGIYSVYTRKHIDSCKLRDRDQIGCSCPKWLYLHPKGGKRFQQAAGTPSFAEACEIGRKILKGFDPEIAKAREVNHPTPGITIDAALEKYQAALSRRSLSAKYVRDCLVPFKRRSPQEYANGRAKNLSLLDFLHRINVAAREPVVRMEQLVSDHLDEWAAGWETNDLSSHIWRGKVKSFFTWARRHDHLDRVPEFRDPHRVKAGNRCGYFTDEQYAKLRNTIPFVQMNHHTMPGNYAARLGAFLDCGRWCGMAVADIVNFSPRVNLGKNNVVTYRRHKNGQIASILLDPVVAARLRSIPPEEGSDPDKPFRFHGTDVETNRQTWRARFQNLCATAGITKVETEIGVTRPIHPHMLRDSFAISAIISGVSLENVAKMLGHASTTMTQRSYLFWVKQRIDHCIEDQRAALARRAQVAPEIASGDAVSVQ